MPQDQESSKKKRRLSAGCLVSLIIALIVIIGMILEY